eukprot:403333560
MARQLMDPSMLSSVDQKVQTLLDKQDKLGNQTINTLQSKTLDPRTQPPTQMQKSYQESYNRDGIYEKQQQQVQEKIQMRVDPYKERAFIDLGLLNNELRHSKSKKAQSKKKLKKLQDKSNSFIAHQKQTFNLNTYNIQESSYLSKSTSKQAQAQKQSQISHQLYSRNSQRKKLDFTESKNTRKDISMTRKDIELPNDQIRQLKNEMGIENQNIPKERRSINISSENKRKRTITRDEQQHIKNDEFINNNQESRSLVNSAIRNQRQQIVNNQNAGGVQINIIQNINIHLNGQDSLTQAQNELIQSTADQVNQSLINQQLQLNQAYQNLQSQLDTSLIQQQKSVVQFNQSSNLRKSLNQDVTGWQGSSNNKFIEGILNKKRQSQDLGKNTKKEVGEVNKYGTQKQLLDQSQYTKEQNPQPVKQLNQNQSKPLKTSTQRHQQQQNSMNKSNVKIELKSTFQDIQDTKKLLKQEQKLLEMSKANEQIATSLDNIQSKILNKSSLKSKYLNNNSIAQVSGVKPNQLGQGNFGEVKLVKKLETQKYFALKCLKKEEIMRNKQIEHIKREKMLLTNIDSPFIVKLQASFQDELNLYFLMEYIQGGELFKQIGSNMMQNSNQEGLVFYLAEIICALEYLHENQKIVYRDLKPENIMIDRDGHIKLIDFGFAKQLTISNNSEYRTYTNCGTPAYISPEILMGIGHCFQSDVWSLGVLICELINGEQIGIEHKREIQLLLLYQIQEMTWI